jgi:sugar diacid utilization regulator
MTHPTLHEMLQDPMLKDAQILAGDPRLPGPDSVCVVESLEQLPDLEAGGIAVLGGRATVDSLGYRLDVTLREVAAQGVAGVMLTGSSVPERVSATTSALARRAGVVLIGAPTSAGMAEIVVALHSAIQGAAEQALRRTEAVWMQLRQAESGAQPGDTEALRAAASEALDVPIELRQPTPGEPSSEVFVDGQVVSTLSAPRRNGHLATATRLSVALTAAAMERSLQASVRTEEAPIRSRDAVLSELLVAGDSQAPAIAARARHLALPIDGWHRALLLQLEGSNDPPGFDFIETLGRLALRSVVPGPHQWHLARSGDNVVILQMWRKQPPVGATREGLRAAQGILGGARNQFTQIDVRCGVGTIHEGVAGLRATVAEARAALASHATRPVAVFDQAGLQTMLLEWYGTDTARQAVKDLLEPLDSLGGERARTAISTLQIYLDEQGSLVRVGERLHLHRNAVAYRMKRIGGLLDADLDDPEQRLALQLACRARLFR